MPGCLNKVGYHKKFIKKDLTPGFKFKTFCDEHRTVKRAQRDEFLKSRGGCENRDARLGFVCGDPNTESLTLDHWDGNRKNGDETNLVVLCANCHNKKTKLFKFQRHRKRLKLQYLGLLNPIPTLFKSKHLYFSKFQIIN